MKSTVDQIRQRFDNDVERFSSLEAGHAAAMDARLAMDLIARSAAALNPAADWVLDIGCGAGNYTLNLLKYLPGLNVMLVDLSLPMLERAAGRIQPVTAGQVLAVQADIREIALEAARFDIILAAAVFHHLRTEDEWRAVFGKCFAALKPGGSLWIFDMIEHDDPRIQALLWQRYGEYLETQKDAAYRERVFAYIEQEDTPRSLSFQMDLLREVGFASVEILHKNAVFAAFGAFKKLDPPTAAGARTRL